ncbi:MAG TPA: hypothetical protein VD993_07570 [Chitinophagaceae bacterium]|nr:hypothetical protein [Chitinophagaceae bacterium]
MKWMFTLFALLYFVSTSVGQHNQEMEVCQVSAKPDYFVDDMIVNEFMFGRHNQKFADSLLSVCTMLHGRKKSNGKSVDLYVTDALNFLAQLGWEVHTVYTTRYRNTSQDAVYYILKRKARP